jgi:hypothetical protein
MTSLPLARLASTSMTAAALLFTTRASSAPKQALVMGRMWSWREPRDPRSRLYSRSEYHWAASAAAWTASLASGALPRLVNTTTPAALITLTSPDSMTSRTSEATSRASSAAEGLLATLPPAMEALIRSSLFLSSLLTISSS